MKLVERIPFVAALLGKDARDFGIGWANGLMRYKGAVWGAKSFGAPNPFSQGSVKHAASEAAYVYMQERGK